MCHKFLEPLLELIRFLLEKIIQRLPKGRHVTVVAFFLVVG